MYEITYLDLEENKEYEEVIKRVVSKCFEVEGLLDSKLIMTITLTTPENIRKINKKYREKYKKPLCCTKNRRHNGFFGIQ